MKERNFWYKVIRPLGRRWFLRKYHPTIIGEENIPKSGPILVCGNHLHVNDQFPAIISTKRVLHYMAKKEYFDGKFGWFFKIAGCIPVDRSIHDESAKETALTILRHGGAIGIFPEGTRNFITCRENRVEVLYEKFKDQMTKEELINKLKSNKTKTSQIDLLDKLLEDKKISDDEYMKYAIDINDSLKYLLKNDIINEDEYYNALLLPFKFGAVSMANKTNATIIPFATTGDYTKDNNNLISRFGKPIVVDGRDLEVVNDELRNAVLSLIKENLKDTEKRNK